MKHPKRGKVITRCVVCDQRVPVVAKTGTFKMWTAIDLVSCNPGCTRVVQTILEKARQYHVQKLREALEIVDEDAT